MVKGFWYYLRMMGFPDLAKILRGGDKSIRWRDAQIWLIPEKRGIIFLAKLREKQMYSINLNILILIFFFKYSPFKSIIWSLKVLIQSYVLNSTGKHCMYVNIILLLFLLWGCQTVEWPETRSISRDTTHEWLTITKVLFVFLSSLSSLSLWCHCTWNNYRKTFIFLHS